VEQSPERLLNALVNAAVPPDFGSCIERDYWSSAMDIVFEEADPRVCIPFLSCAGI
jgi:hypothetical protein